MFVRNVKIVSRNANEIIKRKLSQNFQSKFEISDEVRYALDQKLPVVALESTIITHGMSYPENVQCALEVENIVRQQGATPATVGIKNGIIKAGLTENEINELGDTKISKPIKTSRRDLSYVISNKKNGGTTVSGTLIVANRLNIPIFATGGIGGVHREAETTFDISADLIELGKSNVAVVSSGVKSILDIPKTLEYLETQGVFVATFGHTTEFPGFYTAKSGSTVPYCIKTAVEAARIIKSNKDLNMNSGILLGVPIPTEFEIDSKIINEVINKALADAKQKNIQGKHITPFLLSEIAKITQGKSLISNIALIKNNAKVAADIAVALASLEKNQNAPTTSSVVDIEKRPIIIGGSNMDCSSVLDTDEIKLDGRIYHGYFFYSPGGVGRNMCEAMFKLDCPPNFLTIIGEDFNGNEIKSSIPENCRHLLKTSENKGTGQCNIIFDRKGNCKMLMGDMNIHKDITPKLIYSNEKFIKDAPLIIVDACLSLEALDAIFQIANKHNVPVLYEPTDAAVAKRPFESKHFGAIKFITPNLNELKEIATFFNIKHSNSTELKDLAALAKEIVKYVDTVLVTLGSMGILIARKAAASDILLKSTNSSEIQVRHYPTSEVKELVNVSGAGDCFASGLIVGLITNKSEEICVSVGFAAAKLALLSKSAVPDVIFDKSHESWKSSSKYTTII